MGLRESLYQRPVGQICKRLLIPMSELKGLKLIPLDLPDMYLLILHRKSSCDVVTIGMVDVIVSYEAASGNYFPAQLIFRASSVTILLVLIAQYQENGYGGP